jgi:hypothetical protein
VAEPLTINVQQAAKVAPAVYTVPGSVEVEPLSAFARYDGTGAATPFLAALTFYSSTGAVLARVFPETQVAAGGTADVTFAPFLDSAVAGDAQIGASTWTSATTGGSPAFQTFTPIQFDIFQFNGLSVTTPDFQTFTVPKIGAADLFHVLIWTEIDNSPACPASNWQLAASMVPPENAYQFISGTLVTDWDYVICEEGLYYGTDTDAVITQTVWHDVIGGWTIARCGLTVTYLGQYQ